MQNVRSQIISLLLLLLPLFSYAQVLDYIDVHLKILEKVGDQTQALPNVKLNISDQGPVQTDENGSHSFSYPVRNNLDPQLNISLISEEHKTLKPLDGSVILDPTREEMMIEFLVINVEQESPEFLKRIKDLERKMARLKAKNQLTKRQLNALNRTLLDTILHFETRIDRLNQNIDSLENINEEQQQQIAAKNQENESLKQQVAQLEETVNQLTADLEVAMEERYLRQNEYFKTISTNLNEYVQRIKDLRDMLGHIREYFKFGQGFTEIYDGVVNRYNDAYTTLNTENESYLEGVENYWENRKLSNELEGTFKYLIEGVHARQVYPLMTNIQLEIAKERPKKAQNLAKESREDMIVNIRKLEKDVNRILTQLRVSL